MIRNFKIARWTMFAGMGVCLAGLFIPGAPQSAMLLGGGVLAVGSLMAQGNFNGKRQAVLNEYWPLRNAYDRADGEQQALQSAISATRAMLEPIDAAIHKDRGTLEVVRLEKGVKPKSTTTIEVTRDMVTIGGVRINKARPKHSRGNDADAPAVPAPDGTVAPTSSENGPVKQSV